MTTKSTLLIIEKSLSSCSSSHRPRDSVSILDFFPSSLPFSSCRYPPAPSPPPHRLFLSRYTISISSNFPLPATFSCRWDRNIEREKIFRRASVAASPLSFPFSIAMHGSQPATQPATQPGVVRLLESRIRRGLSRSCLLFFLLFKQTGRIFTFPAICRPSRIIFNEMDSIGTRMFCTHRIIIFWSNWFNFSFYCYLLIYLYRQLLIL